MKPLYWTYLFYALLTTTGLIVLLRWLHPATVNVYLPVGLLVASAAVALCVTRTRYR